MHDDDDYGDANCRLVALPPGTMSLSPERLDAFGSDVREELITRGAYFPLRAVWARRSS